MHAFRFQTHPQRVVFGAGSLQHLAQELDALGLQRALVLSTLGQRRLAERAAERLGEKAAGIFDGAVMHVPVTVAQQAGELASALRADCTVAIGGGSTIGLGKALALDPGLPMIAVPTTYAGSEMTPIVGLTQAGEKTTRRDFNALPRVVIYDPELSLALPVHVSVTSGINAIAHAAEALYAQHTNPVVTWMAEEGIAAMARALPSIRRQADELVARSDALYGAWLCGSVLGHVDVALHHKLCHVLGGSFNLPHAEVHTVVLPHAMAFNADAAPDAMKRIARALGTSGSAAAGLQALARDNGAPMALKAIGLRAEDLDRAADLAVSNPYWNPRPIGRAQRSDVRALLQRAFEGASVD